MAGGASETFALDLESNIAGVALEGADALEALRESISLDTAALGGMQKAMRQLQGGANVDIATFKQLRAQIAAQKATVAQNTAAYVQAGGAFKAIKKPIDDTAAVQKRAAAEAAKNAAGWKKFHEGLHADQIKASAESMRDLKAGISEIPGPLGRVVSLMGGSGTAAVVAITAAIIALGAASIAVVASLVGYAIAMGDARRSEELRLQGLSKFRNFWSEMVPGMRRAADSSGFLQSQLDAVADSSALSRDKIAGMQEELYRAGLRGGNLQAALEGLAIAESAQGAAGAAQFKARAIGAGLYGQSVKKLSDDIKARLGGIAKAQLLSLDVQQRKLHESFARLFKDIHVEPLLEALHSVVAMFSQSTASGRALKALIDGLIQPLISAVGVAGPIVKRFFQGVVIAALLFGITILKVRNFLRDTFGDSKLFDGIDVGRLAVLAGAAAFGALAAVVVACAIFVGLLVAGIAAFVGTVVAAIAVVANFVAGISDLADAIGSRLNWHGAGMMIARGIAAGITGGASEVVLAIASLGATAMKAFREKLGIHSPSKIAFEAALNVPKGIVGAFRAGGPAVQSSARSMAQASEAGMQDGFARNGGRVLGEVRAPQAATGGAAQRGATHVTVAPGAVHIEGGDHNATELAEEIMLKLEDRIVNAARAMGGDI